MTFDLSNFANIGAWLFSFGKNFFDSIVFDFGSFSLSGWGLLLGVAILMMVIYFIARIFQ